MKFYAPPGFQPWLYFCYRFSLALTNLFIDSREDKAQMLQDTITIKFDDLILIMFYNLIQLDIIN